MNSEVSPLASSITVNPVGTLSIGGAFALYPLMELWADSFMAIHPGAKIIIAKEGTGEGLRGLKTGKCDLAMVSHVIEDSDTSNNDLEFIPVGKDAVILITNKNNPYLSEIELKGITPQQCQELFTTGQKITWGKILGKDYKNEVIVYTRYDESGAAEVWAGFIWKTQADLKGLPAKGEDEMIKKIQSTPFSIGYCNLANAFDPVTKKPLENIAIVPIDLDFDRVVDFKDIKEKGLDEFHRSVWLGKYPKTLCRKLTIGVKTDNLTPLINSFLVYILNEGQNSVTYKGYCKLNNAQIRNSYSKLEAANNRLQTQRE